MNKGYIDFIREYKEAANNLFHEFKVQQKYLDIVLYVKKVGEIEKIMIDDIINNSFSTLETNKKYELRTRFVLDTMNDINRINQEIKNSIEKQNGIINSQG